jgi:hypothetical protein
MMQKICEEQEMISIMCLMKKRMACLVVTDKYATGVSFLLFEGNCVATACYLPWLQPYIV